MSFCRTLQSDLLPLQVSEVMLLMYIAAVTGMELIKVDQELPVDHPCQDCTGKSGKDFKLHTLHSSTGTKMNKIGHVVSNM